MFQTNIRSFVSGSIRRLGQRELPFSHPGKEMPDSI
jgi:hypothetical protein